MWTLLAVETKDTFTFTTKSMVLVELPMENFMSSLEAKVVALADALNATAAPIAESSQLSMI